MPATQLSSRSGAWYVDFRYRGHRIRRRSPVQNRRGTEQYERVLREEILRSEERHGEPSFGQPMSFVRFLEHWLAVRAKPLNRPSTYLRKCGAARRHLIPEFGTLPLHAVTDERIETFAGRLAARGLKPKSVVNTLSILHSALSSAHHWGHIRRVPRFPKIRVPEPPTNYLTTEEARKLFAATRPGYWRVLILFLLRTGCRFGEAAALEWNDLVFDPPNPRVRISKSAYMGEPAPTKNGKSRQVPLSDDLAHELLAFREGRQSPYVFALQDGSLPDARRTVRHLTRLCERAGIRRFTWHALRHTFATELSNRSVPIRVIQELLGHSSLMVTARYAHVGGEGVRAAIGRLPAFD